MDSNFQVKITADISALQSSLKNVESDLKRFKASADNASGSMKEGASNANRMSLAAFALGQVIRDSGFFAQNFALGILAISNNIPILIDQLTKLLALSAGVATAISLVASVLTAGLTIWAYSAMAAKDAGEEYEKAMEKANTSSQAQVATFNALLAVARDTNLSYGERKQAIDKLNDGYKGLNERLTVANVNDKESIDLTNRVANSLILQAEATALATLAGEAYVENVRAKNSAVQEYASTETSVYAQILRNLGFFTKAEQALIEDGAKNREKTITDSQKKYDDYAKKLEEINKKLAKSGMLDEGGAKGVNAYKKAIDGLSDSLKRLASDTSLTFDEQNSRKVEAYKNAIGELSLINSKQAAVKIDELRLAIADLNKEILKSEGNKFAVKLFGIKVSEDAKDATEAERQAAEDLANEWERGLYTLDPLYQQAAQAAKNLSIAQKQANDSVTALTQAVGGDLVNAFTEMFQTGKLSFSGIIKAIGSMITRLLAAVAAAALLSVLLGAIFPGSTKVDFKSIFGMLSGLNIGAGTTPVPNAKGGIYSGPTNALVAEYPGARSNPEVIAPLDKLQSILGNNGGGQMGAVIAETRVSGNDLSIILKRADKNRNGYY